MKKLLFIIGVPFVLIIAFAILSFIKSSSSELDELKTINDVDSEISDIFTSENFNKMNITSNAFANNALIPAKYTCDGENINPALNISAVPENAKSLVLIVDDPDAPVGLWVHWLIWNIDVKTQVIAENSVPKNAIEGTTSFGKTGYGGPCPPDKIHRYFFKVYALDTILDLPESATKTELEKAMQNHIIDSAQIIGRYDRSR